MTVTISATKPMTNLIVKIIVIAVISMLCTIPWILFIVIAGAMMGKPETIVIKILEWTTPILVVLGMIQIAIQMSVISEDTRDNSGEADE